MSTRKATVKVEGNKKMKKMKMSCSDCPTRPTCNKLCDAAEKYVSQDDKPSKWRDIVFTAHIDDLAEPVLPPKMETTEAILKDFFLYRHKISDIAKRYNISPQYTRRIIKKYQAIIAQNIRKSVSLP